MLPPNLSESHIYGQLGDTTATDRLMPVKVNGLSSVTAVTAGSSQSVSLKSDGTAWAWGYNQRGQLGDGTTVDRSTPIHVSGLSGVTALAAGDQHTLALKLDGAVLEWGYNGSGQLGDNTTTDRLKPVQVPGLSLALVCNSSVAQCSANTGACVGTAMVCLASNDCHEAGTCDPATGTCSNPAKLDDSTCLLGTCQAGACAPLTDAGSNGGAGGFGSSSVADAVSSSGSESSSTGSNPHEATIDLGCRFGVYSDVSPARATWLGVIALLALRRRRAGLPRAKPQPH